MTTPFEDQRSVWTYCTDPAWLDDRQTGGIEDMRLVDGLDDRQADTLIERLRILRPDMTFEVWDIHNNALRTVAPKVPSTDLPSSRRIGPKRRTLGPRGQ